MRLLSSGSAVDSHDVGAVRRASFRTRLVRIVLVVAALALLVGAAASARGLDAGRTNGLPIASGVAVVDLSLSIGPHDYQTIRATFRRLIASDGSLGVVMFSDVPYEMLPPGTPARELEPVLRLLAPQKVAGKRQARLPSNPWSTSFSAGTRISSALDLAQEMLQRDGISHGSVLLLSDLVTAPEDVPRLARTLQNLQDAGISVKVVPLTPLRDGRRIFEGLLGKRALIPPSRIASSQPLPTGSSSGLPIALLVLGALVLVVLAAHERFAGRLWLPRPEGRPA
jgi:hypothetical protein